MKLKKGDKVQVLAGKDRGKEAQIERVFTKENLVSLPGLNIYKRHMKPKGEGQRGGIMEINRPFDVSKVALVCPKCKKVTRVGYKFLNDKKVRICRKCEQEI